MSAISFSAWPQRILLDERVEQALPKELERIGARRAFVLASGSLAREGAVARLRDALGARFAGTTSAIPAHTPQPSILAAAAEARAVGADAVVSLGGGSIIDAAKLVQAALADDLTDMGALAAWRAEKHPAPGKPIRHIAVPTTLSGAEFTWFAGARHPETGLKQAFGATWMMPSSILFDGALAALTPQTLWLSTGMRAVDHAVESVMSDRSNPFADTLALEGVRRILPALAAGAADPADRAARAAAQVGAWFCSGGLMSGVSMGASHAFGHVIGSLFDIPHGITSCVMLPAVMRFNGETLPDRLARFVDAIGPDPASALKARIKALGLPAGLGEIGIGADQYGRIVDGLGHEAWLKTNPRPVSGRADIERILEMAA